MQRAIRVKRTSDVMEREDAPAGTQGAHLLITDSHEQHSTNASSQELVRLHNISLLACMMVYMSAIEVDDSGGESWPSWRLTHPQSEYIVCSIYVSAGKIQIASIKSSVLNSTQSSLHSKCRFKRS